MSRKLVAQDGCLGARKLVAQETCGPGEGNYWLSKVVNLGAGKMVCLGNIVAQ